MSYLSDEERTENSIKGFEKVINDNDASGPFVLPKALGAIIQNNFKGESCLLSDSFEWMIDEIVTLELKKLLPRIISYCDWLIDNGYDKNNACTDYHNAGYSAVMINTPEMIVLLNSNDDYSYIVKIDRRKHEVYIDGNKSPSDVLRYGIHIRLVECSEKQDYGAIPFESLSWLTDKAKIKDKLFKFNDFRDTGYVISSVQESVSPDYWFTSSAFKNLNMLMKINRNLLNLFYEKENV